MGVNRRGVRTTLGTAALVLTLVVTGGACATGDTAPATLGGQPGATLAPVVSVPAAITVEFLRARVGDGPPVSLGVDIVAEYPQDTGSFTQGLEYGPDGGVFTSSGRYGQSWIGVVEPTTGEVTQRVDVDDAWFAEGLSIVDTPDGPQLVLLTWREGIASFRDPITLTEVRQARYEGEGWGVCDLGDGTVAMSDGSDSLAVRSVEDFGVITSVRVTAAGRPLSRLNELECRGGLVWANVWATGEIVAIDPTDGRVLATLDLGELASANRALGGDVMNGIAAVPDTPDEFLLTGKLWPTAYRVRVGLP